MEYTVILGYELEIFIQTVNDNLSEGWRTIGGIAVSPPPDGGGLLVYYQAMIKPAEGEFMFGGGDETE